MKMSWTQELFLFFKGQKAAVVRVLAVPQVLPSVIVSNLYDLQGQ